MKHFLCLKLHWIINDIQSVTCHVRLLMVFGRLVISWKWNYFIYLNFNLIYKSKYRCIDCIDRSILGDRVLHFSLLHMLTTYAFQLKLNLNSFYYLLLIIVMHKYLVQGICLFKKIWICERVYPWYLMFFAFVF